MSKPYGPDLRLAVLAGDEATVARVAGRMRLGAGWVSTVLQRLVAGALARTRPPPSWCAGRRSRLRAAARRPAAALAERGRAAHGRTGINVWVPVPDETSAVTALRDAGWAVAPGALYRIAAAPGVRITVSPLTVDELPALADAVAAAFGPAADRFTA